MEKPEPLDEEDGEEEKWVKHYSSNQEILLIGDGDFSFSLCLATLFGSASNILATSLHSYECVIKMYKEAKSNLENLKKLGANILHGVDATKMKLHTDLKMRKFDRIIFNFPHAGFYGKEDNAFLIRKHMKLVNGFFKNARSMLRANGEVHVNHKTTAPFCYWDLEGIGSENSLVLIECVEFNKEDYPGYNNKRGDGSRCDEPFPLGESSTFKFCFFATMAKKKKLSKRHRIRSNPIPAYDSQAEFPIRVSQARFNQHQPEFRYPLHTEFTHARANPVPTYHSQAEFPVRMPQPLLNHNQNGFRCPLPMEFNHNNMNADFLNGKRIEIDCRRIFSEYFTNAMDSFGRNDSVYDVAYSVHNSLNQGYARFNSEGRDPNDYICLLEELHRLSSLRSEWLKERLLGFHL